MTDLSDDTGAAPGILTRVDGATIAYHKSPGKSPGVIFCSGFMSDMEGTKALALEASCRAHGRAYLRFDYFGHGRSSGSFEEATIGRWKDDAVALLDQVAEGPQVLVGSSLGGWIMVLAARERPHRVAGLVGVAPAADFTETLMWPAFSGAERETLEREGVLYQPSQYGDEPYAITMGLIEEARQHLVLGGPLAVSCPVRLLQGLEDPDVPWRHPLKLMEALASDDVTLTLVKGGDHRLSEPADIARLCDTVEALCRQVA
jgi:pimeloyl-ACP methyl ester carboxylesterase